MDYIRLQGLRFDTVIGTLAWERQTRQTVLLDLDIGIDAKPAATSDKLGDTVDYGRVAQRLDEFVSGSAFQLIEALAEGCARIVITEFGAQQVTLVLHKPGAVRNAANVALRIERQAADYR